MAEAVGDMADCWCTLDYHPIYEPTKEKCNKWKRES